MVYGTYNYSLLGFINQLITGGPHIDNLLHDGEKQPIYIYIMGINPYEQSIHGVCIDFYVDCMD